MSIEQNLIFVVICPQHKKIQKSEGNVYHDLLIQL